MFYEQIQQIIEKFHIQPSIIAPSLITIQHLFSSQFNKPIIGAKIRNNITLIEKLINGNIPLYPTLYEIQTYLPYFNVDIKKLSQDTIVSIIEASAVYLQHGKSSVVERY